MDALTTIVAVVAFVFFLLLLFYLYRRVVASRESSGNGQNNAPAYPSANYMKYVASRCPDYWTFEGEKDGRNVCQNSFNLPVKKPQACYIDAAKKQIYLPKFGFPLKAGNQDVQNTCKWLKTCGRDYEHPISWSGFDSYC